MKNKKENKIIKEYLEDFIYSDTVPATMTKFVLALVALGGFAIGGAIVPGLIKAMEGFDFEENYPNKKVKNAFHSLKRRKFVKTIKNKNGKIKIKITKRGEKRIKEFFINDLKIYKQSKWDGKWRVLIFDIPIKMNHAREALRKKIRELGFYQFQGSVWFYPYPCEDEILTIAEFFEVGEYIEIITAEKVLHEKELIKHFKLK